MIRYAVLRSFGDWRRSVSMALVLVLAVGSFLLLTGLVEQSQVRTRGTVAQATSAYDIVVRPAGSPATTGALLRPNSVSGTFGGISLAQLDAMRAVSGVELAAPVAMVGETMETVSFPIDVTRFLRPQGTTLLRFTTRTTVLRGSVTVPGVAGYLLVGPRITQDVNSDDGHDEQQLGSRRVRVCVPPSSSTIATRSPFSADNTFTSACWNTRTGLGGRWPEGRGRFVVQVPISSPVMIAAVDPEVEDELVGLRSAMSPGSTWLGDVTAETTTEGPAAVRVVSVPVIAAAMTYVDQDTEVVVDELGTPALATLRSGGGLGAVAARKAVTSAPGTPVLTTTVTAAQAHTQLLHGRGPAGTIYPTILFQPSDVTYSGSPTSGLEAQLVEQGDDVWRTYTFSNVPWAALSPAARTGGFRSVTPIPEINLGNGQVRLDVVGAYDPASLATTSALGRVPMETYQPPTAVSGTDETAQLLGELGLAPDGNPRGYLQQPPLLLVPMSALPVFADPGLWELPAGSNAESAPISAVRVLVAGATGNGDAAQARVRLVATQIRDATGLDVDITKGSSPAPVSVAIPSTGAGHPSLVVDEQWSKLGVATVIVEAIDRKTFTLLALILLASIVAVGITATSAVRARRRELAVLACLGWRPGALRGEVIAELCLVGTLAGTVGGALAAGLAPVVGVRTDPWWYLLAVPIAATVAMAAGAVPAWRAGRTDPVNAVREAAAGRERWRVPLRGVASMAVNYLSPTPGRAVAAAVSLAFGVCALSVLVGIVQAFQGAVVGTVLGAAVTVQVRAPDLIAGGVLAAIGLLCLVNVLYLDLREQAPRYATLQATGWRRATLVRLVLWQALFISTLGSLIGILASVGILQVVVGLHARTVGTCVLVGLAGVAASLVIALVPAASLGRRPSAQLLSAD